MDRFWDYMAESIIVQALITVIVVVTLCYMFLADRDVPESLTGMAMLILGFWFGTKSQKAVATRVTTKYGSTPLDYARPKVGGDNDVQSN